MAGAGLFGLSWNEPGQGAQRRTVRLYVQSQFHGTAGAGRADASGFTRHGCRRCLDGAFDRCSGINGEFGMKLAWYLLLLGTIISGAMAVTAGSRAAPQAGAEDAR